VHARVDVSIDVTAEIAEAKKDGRPLADSLAAEIYPALSLSFVLERSRIGVSAYICE